MRVEHVALRNHAWPVVHLTELSAMKRLRKVTQWVLVWISVGLLSVDPASACRLLANRRCCCCCPARRSTVRRWIVAAKRTAASQEASPSDVPPGARTDAGQLPEAPVAAPSPSVGPTRPIATEAAEPRNAAVPTIVDVRPLTPAAINPAAPAITEPATAPAVAGQATPRQPVGIAPPAATDVAPPAAEISATPRTEAPSLTPLPATLTPRQTFDSATTPTPTAGEPAAASASEPAVPSLTRPETRAGETGTGDREQVQAHRLPRALAAPGSHRTGQSGRAAGVSAGVG